MAKPRLLVNGAKGRMGQEVVRAVRGDDGLELVGECDLGDDLGAAIRDARVDVAVDFTHPDSVAANTETILRAGACPVVGTTGLTAEEIRRLQDLAEGLGRGGVIAPNFAIGAVLLMKFAAEAVRWLPDVEVVELHHEKKVDAPSGTAVKTAEMLREALDRRPPGAPEPAEPVPARESVPGARGGRHLGIPVHSVRLPGYVAHQEVLFGGPGQRLTLRHDAPSRRCFMPGVLLAAKKVPRLERLYYGLEQILEI